jgi:cyclic dehypoxanthinyl futalosine synthase
MRDMKDVLDFYTNASLIELGAEADRVRREKHPHNASSRNINYTNTASPIAVSARSIAGQSTPKGGRVRADRRQDRRSEADGRDPISQGGRNPYIPFSGIDLLRH